MEALALIAAFIIVWRAGESMWKDLRRKKKR